MNNKVEANTRQLIKYLTSILCGVLLSISSAQAEESGTSNKAKMDYILYCAGCHRPDGSGSPGSVPDMRKDLAEFAQFEAGRAYLVQVPGAATAPLNNTDLANVLNWILRNISQAEFNDSLLPLTGEEIAKYRDTVLVETESVRQALIAQIPDTK